MLPLGKEFAADFSRPTVTPISSKVDELADARCCLADRGGIGAGPALTTWLRFTFVAEDSCPHRERWTVGHLHWGGSRRS
jgi:hypothetical protein